MLRILASCVLAASLRPEQQEPLHQAVKKKQSAAIDMLVANGQDVNERSGCS